MAETTDPKPGSKTSEFIIVITAFVTMVLPGVLTFIQQQSWGGVVVAVAGALVAVAYVAMRGLLKLEQAKTINWLTEDQEATLSSLVDRIDELQKQLQPKPPADAPA